MDLEGLETQGRQVAEMTALPACGCSALTEAPAPCRSRDPPKQPPGKPRCLRLQTSQHPGGPSESVLRLTAAKTKTKRRILLCVWECSCSFLLCSPPPRHCLGPQRPHGRSLFTLLATASSPLSSEREAGGFPPAWKLQPRAFYPLCRSGRSDILRMSSGSPVTASSDRHGSPPWDITLGQSCLLSGAVADCWNQPQPDTPQCGRGGRVTSTHS